MRGRTCVAVTVISASLVVCTCAVCVALVVVYPMPESYYPTSTAVAWATRGATWTETLRPRETAATAGPRPTPEALIVDVPGILGESAQDVRLTLGEPVELWRAGEPDSPLPASEGGEWHVYQAGSYLVDAVFDPAGRMRKFILGASYEHLQEEGYRLDASALRLLDRLGMTPYLSHTEPDREVGGPDTAQAWHWYDSNGYTIIILAHPSYSYRVYLVEIRW
ncbi:MAG TPA: hypothetical protein VM537_33445 [Anaerolineae bacterium]|nr:hypothetical protein [Anaerolineae bacterium]